MDRLTSLNTSRRVVRSMTEWQPVVESHTKLKGATMHEKRRFVRHRTLKAGSLEFGGGAIDCVVRNLSETGAAVNVESPVGIPSKITLFVAVDHVRRSCTVVWRKGNRIGVRFDD